MVDAERIVAACIDGLERTACAFILQIGASFLWRFRQKGVSSQVFRLTCSKYGNDKRIEVN